MKNLILALLFAASAHAQLNVTNVNVGTVANDGTGDSLRGSMLKLNAAINAITNKFAQTLDILEFDASTDPELADENTIAIQRAIDRATALGKVVLVPPGTFRHGGLTLTAPIVGTGEDSVLEPTERIMIAASDVFVSNLKILAYTTNGLATTNSAITNIVITGNTFDFASTVESNFIAIDSSFTKGLRIQNNRFFKGGVQTSRADNCLVTDNVFDMEWLNNINEPIHLSQFSRGVISRNTILNSSTDAIDLFSSGDACIVSDNRIIGVGDPTLTVGVGRNESVITLKIEKKNEGAVGGESGDSLGWTENTQIRGNLIRNFNPTLDSNRWYGIHVRYLDARTDPEWDLAEASRNLIISHNIIDGHWRTNVQGFNFAYFAGIHFDGSGAIISENIVKGIQTHGSAAHASQVCGVELGFNFPATGISAVGCVVSKNIFQGEGSLMNIYGATNCVISGNIVQPDYVNNLHPRYGINVYGPVRFTEFSGNVFNPTFASPAAFQTTGSGEIASCIFTGNQTPGGAPWYVTKADNCTWQGNQLGLLQMGELDSFAEHTGNSWVGNHIHGNSALPGIELIAQTSFSLFANHFWGCEQAVSMNGGSTTTNTRNGVIIGNHSHDEQSGTPIEYVDMDEASRRSVIIHGNFVNGSQASSAGSVKIGGQIMTGEIIGSSGIYAASTASMGIRDRIQLYSDTDGVLKFFNWSANGFNAALFGGSTTNFPALLTSNTPPVFHIKDATLSEYIPVHAGKLRLTDLPEYEDNEAALLGGLVAGDVYRNGDAVQIVH